MADLQSSDTLTSSSSCGIWQAGGNGPITDLEKQIIANNRLNTTLSAAIYASSCYTSSPDPLRCSVYTLPSLPSTIDSNASCPFASGMCYFSDTAAYKMDTGKLDSNYHLGMNFPPGERITFQRTTTCAPIHIENYTVIQQVAGVNGTTTPLANVYLGPILDTLETYSYNNDSSNYVDGYTLGYQNSYTVGPLGTATSILQSVQWAPILPLYQSAADLTAYFLSANAIRYPGPIDDPWFAAHVPSVLDNAAYTADLLVSAVACIDQYQFCNLSNNNCTVLSGLNLVGTDINSTSVGLNEMQQTIAQHILNVTGDSDMYYIVYPRGNPALQAQNSESFATQVLLPNNQWQIEVSGWFTTGLARLQQELVNYAAGPAGPLDNGAYIESGVPQICSNQKVRHGSNDTSFSVLGITVIIVICALLVIISLLLDRISGFIQQRWNRSGYRHKQWVLEGKLQMQRLAYEGAGIGTWSNLEEEIPLTGHGQRFGMPDEKLQHNNEQQIVTEDNRVKREQFEEIVITDKGQHHIQ